MRPVGRSALMLGLLGGLALSQNINATTPVVQFLAPPASENALTCAPLSFSWLSRLPEGTLAASASFTLELVRVDSGEPTSTATIAGSPLTSNSRTLYSTPTTPSLRRRASLKETITLSSGLLAMQGAFVVNQLEVAAGWYVLQGTNAIPADAGIAFLSSQPFAVSEGETSCLQNASSRVSPTQTEAPTSSTPSPFETELDATKSHAGVIAGAVLGGFFATAAVLGLAYLVYRQKRPSSHHIGSDIGDSDSVAQWRASRAAAWRKFTGTPLPAHASSVTEKPVHDEEGEAGRARLANLADMLRQAGIQKGIGARRAEALRSQQFELSGMERQSFHSAG